MIKRDKVKLSIQVPTRMSFGGNPVKVYEGYENYGCVMEDNKIFRDTLKFHSISRGRSSVKFNFTGSDGTEYEMFSKDFEKLALSGSVVEVSGEWSFCKRGSNYGVVKIEEEDECIKQRYRVYQYFQ